MNLMQNELTGLLVPVLYLKNLVLQLEVVGGSTQRYEQPKVYRCMLVKLKI